MGTIIDLSKAKLVEVGCYQGESSEIFANRFGEVTCVDIWTNVEGLMDAATNSFPMEHVESNFDKRMSKFNNVIKFKGKFEDFPMYDVDYDVIYIDANHEYEQVSQDIHQAIWKSRIDHLPTFICGHDYTEGWPGVIKAVDNQFGKPHKTFQDGSWVYHLTEGL